MSFYLKDPEARVDYAIDWSGYLDGQTIAEVAAMLRVRPARVYELIRLDVLPGVVRVGRQIRIDAVALDAWIAAGGYALPGGWRREAGLREPSRGHQSSARGVP